MRDNDYKCLVKELASVVKNPNNSEEIARTVNEYLIYYSDRWIFVDHFFSIAEIEEALSTHPKMSSVYDSAWSCLLKDVELAAKEGGKK